MSVNMNTLMQRIKSLREFTIERELPENFTFTGQVPYDMKIADGIATIKIYAADLTEANQKIDEFLASAE